MEICIMCIVNVSNIYHFLFFTCTKVDEQHPQMWSPGSSSLSHAGSFLLQLSSEVVGYHPKVSLRALWEVALSFASGSTEACKS